MTYDVVALVPDAPSMRMLTGAMVAAGSDLRVRGTGSGAVIQLYEDGTPLVNIEAAQRVDVPGEAKRLLGAATAARMPDPCWWVEVRATSRRARAAELAHRFADGLVAELGGAVWPETPRPRGWAASEHAQRPPGHPAVDVETERVMLAFQDRPVVPFSSWLADALWSNAAQGRALHVLSPADAQVTFPLRTMLSKPGGRWVVEEPEGTGHYDGFTGAPLVWDGTSAYVVDRAALEAQEGPALSPAFLRRPPASGSHLIIEAGLVHPAKEDLLLGGGAESLARTFARAVPAGWGTSEPALARWDRAALTATCRRRAPQPAWLTFVGPDDARPFIGTQRVSRVASGVKESIAFAVAYEEGEEPALHRVEDAVREFAEQGSLHVLTAHRMPGRPDGLAYAPQGPSVPVPVGLAIGSEGVAESGPEHVGAAPVQGHRVGAADPSAFWFPLGEGTGPEGWERFGALLRHFRPQTAAGA